MDHIAQVLAAIRMAQSRPLSDDIVKAWTQSGGGAPGSTGLVYYDLQAPALKLYPVITPLRNRIPRVSADGGTATNWKAITDINTDRLQLGVLEGRRGGVIKNKVVDYTATYKGLGLEESLTFESEYAAKNFDDVRARAVESLLRSFMIAEELVILGGNASFALGTPGTIVATPSNTGGTLTNAASPYHIRVVALTLEGYYRSSVAGGVKGEIVRSDADGGTTTYGGGASQASAAVTATIASGTTGSIAVKVPPVRGAFAYAWFLGTDATTNCKLTAITTVSNAILTTNNTSGMSVNDADAKLLSQDNSRNQTTYDGLLGYCTDATNGSYYKALGDGTGTSAALSNGDGAGIAEIDEAFKSFWDNYRLSPDMMLCNAQEITNITKKVINAGGAPLIRINRDVADQGLTLSAGLSVGTYLNRYTMTGGQMVPIILHPNMPPGTIYFHSWSIPYPLSNVTNIVQLKMRRDYYQIEWPLKTRRYEFGIYADGLLQHYFPPSCGILTNIADG